MDHDAATRFARDWLDAWNAHDIEAVLAHFADDAVFASPVAQRVFPGSDGVLRGKPAIRDYWARALTRMPELRFELLGVYAGVGVIVIHYRNQAGGLVNEVLVLDADGADGVVVSGYGTYAVP
jgi:hypothetical protein